MRRLSVRDKVELKSQVKENSRNPEWNEHFRLLVYKPDQEVWHPLPQVWTASEELSLVVPISQLLPKLNGEHLRAPSASC